MDHAEAGSELRDMVSEDARYESNTWNTQQHDMISEDARYESNPLNTQGSRGIDNIGFCAMPADNLAPLQKKGAANTDKRQSLGSMLRHGITEHQLGITLNLILLLGLTYAAFPSLRDRLRPFVELQYALSTGQYLQGPQDAWIVLGFIVLFTGIRAACLDFLLLPMAKTLGIKRGKLRLRFAEQAYLLLYYTVIWSWGVHLFVSETPKSDASTFLGQIDDLLMSLWSDWPRSSLAPSMKAYYLLQTAFWVQQILVIHLEERRKDHWQMLAHHFITSGLLICSYSFRQIRVGNAVLVLMDVVDLIFPVSCTSAIRAVLLTRYSLRSVYDISACRLHVTFAFGAFVITWFFARHVAYLAVMYSMIWQLGITAIPYGTYSTITSKRVSSEVGASMLDNLFQPMLNPGAQTVQFTSEIRNTFIAFIGGLQVITIFWGILIVRVVARVLRGEGADDSRSEDEDEDESEIEEESKIRPSISRQTSEQKYIEIPADADELYYPQRTASNSRVPIARKKSKGISSGLNLGEHKDILNRIGCLSDEQLAREAERRQQSTSPQPGPSRRF